MRDDVTFVELVHRDLREVRWPEPAEIRAQARGRSRRTAVTAAAAVLVLASVSAVVVGRAVAPAPPPAATASEHAEIPAEAMLAPADVPAKSDERLGDTGLGERVRVDDVLRTCGQERGLLEDQAVSRYSRSQTLIGTATADGFAPYRRPVVSQDVYRLEAGAAGRVFADLDRLVAACTTWRQVGPVQAERGTVTTTLVHRWTVAASDFAGDQAILLRHTVSVPPVGTTGKPAGIPPWPEDTLVVRVGDLVTVLVPGEPLRLGVPGNTVTEAQLLDVARAAARRMCAAANPGC
ncbi:hypothetical protein U2F26_04330 [Micromonospora sp. 4G57]|uniref:PknH-like extracellular domain-containing protein n=1 Tax=Micromonospora sicca TaxID=2202420 RepID=A0ABU5JDE3_9ACTN|nr:MULTISPECIES: hypothetical protein [unclassified Micromonospora]MDZ5441959.1 hypothetical protein [Micromonospora sp. 4G57]MDZ5490614.1 hypothetical protein [Micromonospora sp. 4G53]